MGEAKNTYFTCLNNSYGLHGGARQDFSPSFLSDGVFASEDPRHPLHPSIHPVTENATSTFHHLSPTLFHHARLSLGKALKQGLRRIEIQRTKRREKVVRMEWPMDPAFARLSKSPRDERGRWRSSRASEDEAGRHAPTQKLQ